MSICQPCVTGGGGINQEKKKGKKTTKYNTSLPPPHLGEKNHHKKVQRVGIRYSICLRNAGKLLDRSNLNKDKELITCCSSICMRSLSPALAFCTSSNSPFVLMHSFIFSSNNLFNRTISFCIKSEFVCKDVMPSCCSGCDFSSFNCR